MEVVEVLKVVEVVMVVAKVGGWEGGRVDRL